MEAPQGRAATLAAACLSYSRGGPGRALALRALTAASAQDIDNVGRKYHLKLVLEDILDKDNIVNCTAEVLYHLGNTNVAPDVHFEIDGELKSTDEQDNMFYNQIRSLKEELVAQDIPDSHGNVPPEMEPIRALAQAAAGYVVWQNSTEDTRYHLAQIKHVRQVKRSDDYLEFDYMVLLHEFVSQKIPPCFLQHTLCFLPTGDWQMTVLWHPQHGVKVTQNSRQPKRAER
ncbi:latexin [Nothoprocta perdicaria]|uniref:latexin n=1 Tax=Nothoprocta perdicaria TaxID=30464 RepID=UPI000E1BB916|nr:latexin [Nothoprocta perdicaria]